MTIFYGRKVLVFNDLPSERVEEIIAMAGKGIVTSSISAPSVAVSETVIEPVAATEKPPAKASDDLPIARRASLHRFFEKIKDRVASTVPYQVSLQQYSASSKPAGESYKFNNGENKQSSSQFDLNL